MADAPALQILVVDDSALMRNLVGRIIENENDLELAGKAMNGKFALTKLSQLKADVIILDLEMPEMNGLEFLEERRKRNIEIPVIVLSAVAQKGASITMEALQLGAADFIPKPTGADPDEIRSIGSSLVEMVRSYGNRYRASRNLPPGGNKRQVQASTPQRVAPVHVEPPRTPLRRRQRGQGPGPIELVAIGISTGGPNALRQVFSELPADLGVPVLVVQHMPAGFTGEFAKSLDRISPLDIKEAADGDIVRENRVLIAPGDRHMIVEKRSLATVVRLDDSPPVSGHRPSVDVLFESVARTYGNRTLAVIMTGMGRDGAEKLGDIYEAGGLTIGQDQATSVVYGMPRVACEYGHIVEQLPLPEIAGAITRAVRSSRSAAL